MSTDALFSSTDGKGSEDWATPLWLFDELDREFGFDLDCCASSHNAKVDRFIGKEGDALACSWREFGSVVWCNPPYGRQVSKWVRQAYQESRDGLIVVMLLPARTDTIWFHDYGLLAEEIRFIRGRLHFERADGHTGPATFPSMILVFDKGRARPQMAGYEQNNKNKRRSPK